MKCVKLVSVKMQPRKGVPDFQGMPFSFPMAGAHNNFLAKRKLDEKDERYVLNWY